VVQQYFENDGVVLAKTRFGGDKARFHSVRLGMEGEGFDFLIRLFFF